METKVLIIEDDRMIVEIVEYNLRREGYDVVIALDGEEGLEAVQKTSPDIILLDVMLPGIDGFDLLRRIREFSEIPVIMVTAREEEADKVLGLDLGADDYITKPFSMRELLARIKANIRRRAVDGPLDPDLIVEDVIEADGLRINPNRQEVSKNGKRVELTIREYELLKFLATIPGRVFSREELMEKVWGYENFYGDMRAVDVTVRRLREKVEQDPANPALIITKRGAGYFFAP